jgi:hypothetical protein
MKHTMFVCLFFVFAVGMNVEGIAQEDQEGGIGMGLRDLRGGAMYPHPTNSKTVKKHRRIENARILTGVRRLVPQDYPTIQAAIDSSVNGDTVLVSDGTYLENIRFRGKAIVVASLFIIDDDTTHIEQTIIDGSNPSNPDSASVVYFIDGEDTTSVLCGFTITGGAGTPWTLPGKLLWRAGGGVFCDSGYGATIINNHITANRVSGQNAGGGGVFFFDHQSFLILERNRIFDNRVSANPGGGRGGGAWILGDGLYASIVENVFERDTTVGQDFAIGAGAEMTAVTSLAEGVIHGNVFRGNIANATVHSGIGGGLAIHATTAVEVRDNFFEGNIAKSRDGWGDGGGLIINDEPPVSGYGRKLVVGNRFVDNMASSQFYDHNGGGAIELYNSLATISENYFEQNTAQGPTPLGGAIRIYASAFRLENNIYFENSARFGGAVYVSYPSSGTVEGIIINNTMVNNHAGSGGGGIGVGGGIQLVNSILWGNTPDQIALNGGSILVRHSDIQDGWMGDGNIATDPLFVSGDTLFHLTNPSPCVNMGVDSIQLGGLWYFSPANDYEGDDRPFPGSLPDMGADETNVIQAYASNATINQSYLVPGVDSLLLGAEILNPDNQNVEVKAMMESLDQSVLDSITIFDDGLHQDSTAGDYLFAGSWPVPSGERHYKVHIRTLSADSGYYHLLLDAARFTTIGPVVVDHYEIAFQNPTRFAFKLSLRNDGSVSTAPGVSAAISTADTNVTRILNNNQNFGDITAGEIKTPSNYVINTQNNPASVHFTIRVFSDGWFFWSDSMTVTITGIAENESDIPLEYALRQSYPNPFNPTATITYQVPRPSEIRIEVYNTLGQKVRTLLKDHKGPGVYQVIWDGRNNSGVQVGSGVYLYRMVSGDYVRVRKMILMR